MTSACVSRITQPSLVTDPIQEIHLKTHLSTFRAAPSAAWMCLIGSILAVQAPDLAYAQGSDPSLVAAYHCNESTGTVLTDVSGRGNNGAVPAGAWSASGRFGAALSLNGTSHMVTVPDSASLDLTNGMTLEAWVYPTATTDWQTVLIKETNNGLAYALYARVDSAKPGGYINTGGGDVFTSGNPAVPLNAWTHVALTFNGSVLRLYVNGTLRSSTNITGSMILSGSPLRIGGNVVWGEFFKGQIDEIRVYNRALTATEIVTDRDTPVTAGATAPTISLTSPTSGSTVSGVINITANATGSPGVAGVQFKLDGVNLGTEDTAAPYQVSWDTAATINGSHTLTAVVRDTSNATAVSAPVTVTVSNGGPSGPTVTLTAPASGSTLSGVVTLTATATGSPAVAGVQFKVDGQNVGSEDTTGPYSISWDTTTTVNGPHVITATVRDTGTGTATSSPVSVTIANGGPTPPTVTLTAPVSGSTVSGVLQVTASATGSPAVAGVQFKLDGVNLGVEDTVAPYSVSWDTSAASNGSHTLTATVRDTGTGTATSSPVSVTVSNVVSPPPTVTINAPTSGSTVSGTVTITANATGSPAVAGVQFKLDGVNLGVEDTTAPYSFSWDSTTATNAAHSLTATVRDTSGRTANSATVSVTVANFPPPTVTITAPAPGIVSGTVTVSANASGGSGIAGVQFVLNGSPLGAEDTVAPYSISWNSQTVSDGAYSLAATTRTTTGATATSTPVAVTVANGSNLSVTGQWSIPQSFPIVTVHAILTATGKVLMFDRPSAGPTARLWDPITNTFTAVPNNTTDIFCSGHVSLFDGRVLIAGGHGGGNPFLGTADTNIFDPFTLTWSLVKPMAFKRWYPTVTALPDGRVLVMSGTVTNLTDYVATPEVYNPTNDTWTSLTSANLSMPTYPEIYVLPDGRIVNPGNYEAAGPTRFLNVTTQSWTTFDTTLREGQTVMYEAGKIMKTGSSADSGFTGPSLSTTYAIDFTAPTPAWQQTPSMQYPRAHHNLTILADGTVLATGGGTQRDGYYIANAVYHAELWNPATKAWSTVAPASTPRLYHSIALLLPDGRVLNSGGGRDGPGIDQLSAELYSPPYLFKGPRPVIGSAPDLVDYGTSFAIQTADAASVAAIHLIKIGSPTHGYDMDQRLIKLSFTPGSGQLTAVAPANANVAPPGYYMLFLLNGNGVPSVAKIVRLPLATGAAPPTAPANLSAVGGIGTSSLNWTASNSTVGISNYNVHRSTSAGFVPSIANRIAQPVTTSFVDQGLAAGRYYYKVNAVDTTLVTGGFSNEAFADVVADNVPPQVAITSPSTATVSGVITVAANATDDNGVLGVQFLLDGSPLGNEVTAPPYAISWNTTLVPNGQHTLAARARDTGSNLTTSIPITVTVSNTGPTGLVLAMAFNEGAGSTTEDRSGYSNSGLLQGTAWSATGKFGGSLSFNGTSSFVSVNDAPQLDLTTGMTLMAWVNPTAISSWRTIMIKEDTNDLAYVLYANTDENRPGGYVKSGGTTNFLTGGSPPPLNTWTHLALTRDATTLKLFVNGVQVATGPAGGAMNNTVRPLKIGGNAIWSEWFQGLIDEVRIYDKALTAAEIQTLMNTPIVP